MNVTEAIAESLAAEGVDYLFGFPSNPLFDTGAIENRGIEPIVVRQERTGVHMADAVSRVSSGEEIGVFACQHGPGAENAFGGVAQAYAESAPLVAFPRGYDRSKTDIDPKFSSVRNYQHVTTFCEQLTDPEAVADTVRRAFSAARTGRPRPALVEIPMDVWDEEIGEFDYTPAASTTTGPDPDDIPPAVDALLAAERPVIYAGQGVHYAKAWEPLRELAELLEASVATSLNGKSAFPENHPLSLGAGSMSEPRPLAQFLAECDLLFGVGTSFSTTAYGITVPEENEIIHATLDPTDIDKEVESDHAIVGDAELTLEAMVEETERRLDGPRRRDVASEIKAIEEEWLAEWRPKLESDETPINPYRVINELSELIDPENTIITHDAGNARDFLAPFWTATEPLSYIGWGKTTQLGYGLGLAMGAKLVHPEKLCINVWGDGAIGMTGLDIETAVRYEIPILSVLLNNDEMAGYDTPLGGNFATVAEGLGAYAERIEASEEIADALERGIRKTEEGTPVLLEFVTASETELSRPDLE